MNVTTAYDSASFVCTVRANGLMRIVWKRVNYTLPVTATVTERKLLNELSSTLTISEIVGYYSGQYYCIAENEVGKVISKFVNLHVKTSKVTYSYGAYAINSIYLCHTYCTSSNYKPLLIVN